MKSRKDVKMNSLDLSNPDQWNRKTLNSVIEKAKFKLANKHDREAYPNISKLGLVANYKGVEIIVDNGIITVFGEYEGENWFIDFNQGEEYDDGDRVF